jgi:hypothetical protein
VLSNKQRANGSYEWRTRLLRTGRRIIDIERRARASAAARGKAADVAAADSAADSTEKAMAVNTAGDSVEKQDRPPDGAEGLQEPAGA